MVLDFFILNSFNFFNIKKFTNWFHYYYKFQHIINYRFMLGAQCALQTQCDRTLTKTHWKNIIALAAVHTALVFYSHLLTLT
jgi:hypothetical protein